MQDTLLSRPAATNACAADTKEDVLAKLLQHGMETLESLSRITGWGEKDTQRTLLSLIAAGRADCKSRNGRRVYGARVQ